MNLQEALEWAERQTNTNPIYATLAAAVRELEAENTILRNRLRIDLTDGGSDEIDALEMSVTLLKQRAEAAEHERDELRAENAALKEEISGRDSAHRLLQDENERLRSTIGMITEENNGYFEMTKQLDEHPESYDGPCLCKLCLSYGV